jgi:hypothetical protein
MSVTDTRTVLPGPSLLQAQACTWQDTYTVNLVYFTYLRHFVLVETCAATISVWKKIGRQEEQKSLSVEKFFSF